LDYQRSGVKKQCSGDCCGAVSADVVRRFAEGEDEIIPGDTEENSPYARYASTSPPSSGNGDAPQNGKQLTPTLAVAAPAAPPPMPPAASPPVPYDNYNQFVPSNIDTSAPAPGTYAQIQEPWFYTPASAHAAFAMDYSPSSAEAFDGLNGFSPRKPGEPTAPDFRLAMPLGGMPMYQPPAPGDPNLWASYPPPQTPRVQPWN
jgi:hypothetical protein